MTRPARPRPTVTLECRVLEETDLAVRVTAGDPDRTGWVPKSLIQRQAADAFGWEDITLPEWKAHEAGLI